MTQSFYDDMMMAGMLAASVAVAAYWLLSARESRRARRSFPRARTVQR